MKKLKVSNKLVCFIHRALIIVVFLLLLPFGHTVTANELTEGLMRIVAPIHGLARTLYEQGRITESERDYAQAMLLMLPQSSDSLDLFIEFAERDPVLGANVVIDNLFGNLQNTVPSSRFASVQQYLRSAYGQSQRFINAVANNDRVWAYYYEHMLEYIDQGVNETARILNSIRYGVDVVHVHALLRLSIGNVIYTHNGVPQTAEVAPFIYDGRTMIPLRLVAETLGAEVNWSAETRTVTIDRNSTNLSLVLDSPLPNNMGTPTSVSGRTFVPVRYVSEMLGAHIRWDGVNFAVYVYSDAP